MGVVRPAGWAVVTKAGDVIARMATRKAARRRCSAERAAGRQTFVVELVYSDGLIEE